MSSNQLLDALRANDKTGHLFETNSTFIAYKTGYPALDYAMGFNVNVFDENGKVKDVYPSIGITGGSIVTIVGKTHVGKAQPIDTPIPTPDGWRMLGDLEVGDYVFNRYGRPVKILGVFDQGKLNVCRVTFEDGRTTLCNDEHIWSYFTQNHTLRNVTTAEMMENGLESECGNYRYAIPTTKEVQYPEQDFPVHPYVVGTFIGNGYLAGKRLLFSSSDLEIVEKITKLLNAKSYVQYDNSSPYSFYFELQDGEKSGIRKLIYTKDIFGEYSKDLMCISSEKRIPQEYLHGNIEQRYELLRGLLDTDGNIDKESGSVSYCTTSYGLVKDIQTLCRSLGITATYAEDKRHEKYKCGHCYTVYIICKHWHKEHLFSLTRKKDIAKSFSSKPSRYHTDRLIVKKIEDLEYSVPMRCIYVDDPEHLYLTNDYIVTHNTSAAIQIASNIIRPFKNGSIMHYDLENGTNMTRISTLSRFNASDLKDRYVLRQQGHSIEEIKKSIARIYTEKTSNPDQYMYDTGKLDEFGNEIKTYEPTCIIIDSVPSLTTFINENTKDGAKALEEITSQTDRMRMTAEVGRFLSESMQMMKAANIIMFLINHIKEKPPMGTPQAPELRGLKQNETMPCGKALQYYSNMMIRLTSIGAEKYTVEEHGFDGFGVQVFFIKNRSNSDGVTVPLVFDKGRGYDSILSSVMYAKEVGLLGGNKNGHYFIENKESKFRFYSAREDFAQNRELYTIMYSHIIPVLEHSLSSYKPEELYVCEEEMMY